MAPDDPLNPERYLTFTILVARKAWILFLPRESLSPARRDE
jgi:hypothetical protein